MLYKSYDMVLKFLIFEFRNGVQLRRNSWQDGVQGTNCPILPGQNWTYHFQVKDQIGSFFYFPSLHFQKAAGGFGAIRVNNRAVIPIPFSLPYQDFDVLIGDWYNADYQVCLYIYIKIVLDLDLYYLVS